MNLKILEKSFSWSNTTPSEIVIRNDENYPRGSVTERGAVSSSISMDNNNNNKNDDEDDRREIGEIRPCRRKKQNVLVKAYKHIFSKSLHGGGGVGVVGGRATNDNINNNNNNESDGNETMSGSGGGGGGQTQSGPSVRRNLPSVQQSNATAAAVRNSYARRVVNSGSGAMTSTMDSNSNRTSMYDDDEESSLYENSSNRQQPRLPGGPAAVAAATGPGSAATMTPATPGRRALPSHPSQQTTRRQSTNVDSNRASQGILDFLEIFFMFFFF